MQGAEVVIIGGVFLNEKLPPQTLSGGILILSAIGLIVFGKKIQTSVSLDKFEVENDKIKDSKPLTFER